MKEDTEIQPDVAVQANIYHWKQRPTFDQMLCEVPEEIHILETGQVIVYYGRTSEVPKPRSKVGLDDIEDTSSLRAKVPPMPYDDLDDMLEEHSQGCLSPNDLRDRLEKDPSSETTYTETTLKKIWRDATGFWGSNGVFALGFEPRTKI